MRLVTCPGNGHEKTDTACRLFHVHRVTLTHMMQDDPIVLGALIEILGALNLTMLDSRCLSDLSKTWASFWRALRGGVVRILCAVHRPRLHL